MNQRSKRESLPEDPELAKNLRIYTSKIKAIPENIIIANYSGVLTCYDLVFNNLWQPVARVILIILPFWLDSVHESRLETLWGQNFREFPQSISRLLLQLDPQIKNQERLTFRQVQLLRRACIGSLKEKGHFKVIEGKCEYLQLMREKVKREPSPLPLEAFRTSIKAIDRLSGVKVYNRIEYLKIRMEQGKEYLYELRPENKVYDFSQQPVNDKAHPFLPPQTQLYQLPKGHEPENIIVLGAGLSAIWVKEQAPLSKVRVAIRNPDSKIAAEISRNRENLILREDCLFLNQCHLLALKPIMEAVAARDEDLKEKVKNYAGNGLEGCSWMSNDLVAIDKKSEKILEMGRAYTAFGFARDGVLTAKLPENMIIAPEKLVDKKTFYAPKNIPFNAFFGRHEAEKRVLMQDKFKVEDINLKALVIREEDKSLLAFTLNTDRQFINFLCKNISEIEDTPENSEAFIQSVYQQWINQALEKDNSAEFNTRLAALFHRMEMRPDFGEKFSTTARNKGDNMK